MTVPCTLEEPDGKRGDSIQGGDDAAERRRLRGFIDFSRNLCPHGSSRARPGKSDDDNEPRGQSESVWKCVLCLPVSGVFYRSI